MIDETLADAERQLLIVLATQALVRISDDRPAMDGAIAELTGIIRKLAGTDTQLIARRAYASEGRR